MFAERHQQLGPHLLMYAQSKFRSRNIINRDDDHAAQRATKERYNPFRGIRSPDQDALALPNASCLQLARKLEGGLGHPPIAPAFGAIAATLYIRALISPPQEIIEVFDQQASMVFVLTHLRDGSASPLIVAKGKISSPGVGQPNTVCVFGESV